MARYGTAFYGFGYGENHRPAPQSPNQARIVAEVAAAEMALALNSCPNGCGPLTSQRCSVCQFRHTVLPPAKVDHRVDFYRSTRHAQKLTLHRDELVRRDRFSSHAWSWRPDIE